VPADALLARSPVFGLASVPVRTRLAARASTRRVPRGAYVFHQGDRGDAAYLVVSGRVKLVASVPSGDELVLAAVGPGDSFGELAALDGEPRSAAAVALVGTELLVLPAADLRAAVVGDPALADAFLAAMAVQIRLATERRGDLLFLDLAGRIAKHLLAAGTDVVELDLAQGDLARLVGGSRQSVNAALRALHRDGVVAMDGRRVTIRDAARLRVIACQPADRHADREARR